MKNRMWLAVIAAVVLMLAGCGEPVADFAAGLGTGLAIKVQEANQAMEKLDKNIAAVNTKADELQKLIKQDPSLLVNTLDPNLGVELQRFIVNANNLKAEAEKFKEDDGDIDWSQIGTAGLAALLAAFGGWNGSRYINTKKG